MKGLCHSCLTSNLDLVIHGRTITCVDCSNKGIAVVASPIVLGNEFPELKILSEDKRRESSDKFTQKVFDKMKNSLIHGVPE